MSKKYCDDEGMNTQLYGDGASYFKNFGKFLKLDFTL